MNRLIGIRRKRLENLGKKGVRIFDLCRNFYDFYQQTIKRQRQHSLITAVTLYGYAQLAVLKNGYFYVVSHLRETSSDDNFSL